MDFGIPYYYNIFNCRKEGKHREIKMYTKNSNNRINVPISVANKVQYNSALRAFSSIGLEDILTTSELRQRCVKDKVKTFTSNMNR